MLLVRFSQRWLWKVEMEAASWSEASVTLTVGKMSLFINTMYGNTSSGSCRVPCAPPTSSCKVFCSKKAVLLWWLVKTAVWEKLTKNSNITFFVVWWTTKYCLANNDSRTHFEMCCGVNRYLYSSPRFILSAVCCFIRDYGCKFEGLPYCAAIPWLSWRRVFKTFCGLLSERFIPLSGINHKVRDIQIWNENLVHFEAFRSLNFRDSYILLIDTQKIVYCSKTNWKIDFKISRFLKWNMTHTLNHKILSFMKRTKIYKWKS